MDINQLIFITKSIIQLDDIIKTPYNYCIELNSWLIKGNNTNFMNVLSIHCYVSLLI